MAKKTTTTTTVTTVVEDVPSTARKTYVALVLDRSSSMGAIRDQAISLFNEQLYTLQKAPEGAGDTFITLVTFASDVQVPIMSAKPSGVSPLNPQTYVPDGWTSMYDGMGRAINLLRSHDVQEGEDRAFLVITITDGEENHSTEFTGTRLSSLIRELKATGRWSFTVAGANVNLDALADKLGIPKYNMYTFTSDAAGTYAASASTSRGLGTYLDNRAMGEQNVTTFYSKDDDTSVVADVPADLETT